jgi:hypothetical protein
LAHASGLVLCPSTNKSIKELNDLVKNVVLAPDFKTENFIGFDAAKSST